MTNMFRGKSILVTGGTGSIGSEIVRKVLQYEPEVVRVLSNDENGLFNLEQELLSYSNLRFLVGDVKDKERLRMAIEDIDFVFHAAALKHVPLCEYNPFEAVKTNIIGSQNVIDAAIDQGVEKVLLISTDKAAQPINLYGSTKLCAEKLFINGNSYASRKTKFSCVRYGNVLGSRGSIVEVLLKNKDAKKVYLTDEEMTRFWITLEQSFKLVFFALDSMAGGEIFIPKIPSMRIIDLFDAIVPGAKKEIIGIRPGEKLHELLLTPEEARHSIELKNYFVILPEDISLFNNPVRYKNLFKKGKKLPSGFYFSSDNNKVWLSKKDFQKIIEKIELHS